MKEYGLTTQQVEERVARGAVNVTGVSASKSTGDIVREHTLTYFNALNVVLAGVILSTGRYQNMMFMGGVIMNTLVGIVQELRVRTVIDKISIVNVATVPVLRDNREVTVNVEDVVQDDVVVLSPGMQICADGEVLVSTGLEINEALLTGETQPVVKQPGDPLLSGTFVNAGTGLARMTRVGANSYANQIIHQARHRNQAASEMKSTITAVIRVLSIAIIPIGLFLFRAQYSANPTLNDAIVKTVGGIIGMIPEGLVLLTSLSFVIGVGRLALKKALVQDMEAIEALARADELCLDKTGTITTGDLQVKYVIPSPDVTMDEIKLLMGSLAHQTSDDNATQRALKAYFVKNDTFRKTGEVPFSSERKYRVVSLEGVPYVLGAPEYLLPHDHDMMKEVDDCAALGMRVLALGACDLKEDGMSVHHVRLIALIVISDIIKEDAPETFRFFKDHNVSIRVLSGDNPLTVSRVCQLAGVSQADRWIDAEELPDDDDALRLVVEKHHVFGRVRPETKQRIIKALQANGHVTAMVGDGVNDVLAIKDADCGIAMASGAQAARQAAHIVLLDSDFASMKDIVNEGRTIIGNIERVSSLYLNKTIFSLILCLVFGFIGMTYPYQPVQLTLIGMFAIGVPSFFITLEFHPEVTSGGFLRHVLHVALPCALSVATGVLVMLVLHKQGVFDEKMYVTISFWLTDFVALIVLFRVSWPFNILRGIVFALMVIISFGAIWLTPTLMGIYPLGQIPLRRLVFSLVFSVLAVIGYTLLVDGIMRLKDIIFFKKHMKG